MPGDEGVIELEDISSSGKMKPSGTKDRIEEKLNQDIDGDGKIGPSSKFLLRHETSKQSCKCKKKWRGMDFSRFPLSRTLECTR